MTEIKDNISLMAFRRFVEFIILSIYPETVLGPVHSPSTYDLHGSEARNIEI